MNNVTCMCELVHGNKVGRSFIETTNFNLSKPEPTEPPQHGNKPILILGFKALENNKQLHQAH